MSRPVGKKGLWLERELKLKGFLVGWEIKEKGVSA